MKKLRIMQALLLSSLSIGLMVDLQSKILKQGKAERYLKADRANRAREARAHYALFLNLKRELEDFNYGDMNDLDSRVAILDELKTLTSKANFLIQQNSRRNILPALSDEDLELLGDVEPQYQQIYENFLDDAKESTLLAFGILDPDNDKLTEEELKKKLNGLPNYDDGSTDKKHMYERTIPLILGTIDLLKEHTELFDMYKNNDLFTVSEAQLRKILHDEKQKISSEQNI